MKPRNDDPMQPSDFRERDRLEGNSSIPPAADCDMERARAFAEQAKDGTADFFFNSAYGQMRNLARCFQAQAEALAILFPKPESDREGRMVSNDACDNLDGARIDIEAAGKADEVSLRTVRRVLEQLGEARARIAMLTGRK